MSPYRVMVVGMGKRGRQHVDAFDADPAFEVVGLVNRSSRPLADALAELREARMRRSPKAPTRRSTASSSTTHPDTPSTDHGISVVAPHSVDDGDATSDPAADTAAMPIDPPMSGTTETSTAKATSTRATNNPGSDIATGADAAALAAQLQPDVFCFTTPPSVRLPMIEAAIEAGARLVAFEKPIALTSAEAFAIRDALQAAGVKAVVSHQHRYGSHYQAVKQIIASGQLGRVHTVYGSATGWMTHMLSHLVDYTMWFNDYAPGQWAMAQASGRAKLTDSHPSADYLGGFVQYDKGVRGIYECGLGAPDQPEVGKWWGRNRIGAQGTEGFAEVLTNGGWRAVTASGGFQHGDGAMDYATDMPPYIRDMARWLDDDTAVHPCAFDNALLGAQVVFAMQRSAALGGQVALPLATGADEQALLVEAIPDTPALASSASNLREFGLG